MASSDSDTDTSVSAFLSTFIINLILFTVFLGIFIILRKRQKRVYEPRVVVDTLPNDIQPEASPKGAFGWVGFLIRRSESFLIQQCGVDGYFYIRFLFEFGIVCVLGAIITWPVLFSVNATNSNGDSGFSTLAFGNVKNKNRYYAHVFISWIFFGAVTFLIYRELVYYTTFRHVVQTTPLYDSLLSSRTLLLTQVPTPLMEEDLLRSHFPTANNVWYARDYKELQKKVKERTKLAGKYEKAVNGVLSKAVKMRNKAIKKKNPVPEPANEINAYLKDGKKRPTHRLKFLIGKKVDTLDYGVERLGELNREIKKAQSEHNANTQTASVFLEFPNQLELQKAYQAVPYNKEFKSTRRFTGLAPDDIIWDNLTLSPTKRLIKKTLASTVLTLMIIFWCIPVAVVGAISNINFLISKVHFLKFIDNMPSVLLGVITGLLPTIMLAVLMSLIPPFIKFMGKVSGCITVQQVESYCQSWYFAFQVVNAFLVVTLASAASSAVTEVISDPTSALKLLAQKLPNASNFYLSYICLQGLTISSKLLLQMVPLILAQFLGKILDKTPRAKWNRFTTLGQPGYSTLYPAYQFMAVIALAYAIISPLILGFSAVAYALIYFAFVYTLVYVLQPNQHDARGRNYPAALLQLFTGIYLSEVLLVALFVFSKNWACVALEGVWIAVTAAAHIYMKWKLLPLWEIVPISAIKYASGDTTFEYPMYDQGLKESKIEGQNYWEGGNELGLSGSQTEHVLPESQNNETKGSTGSESSDKHEIESNSPATEKPGLSVSPKAGVSWFKIFFKPKTETFDMLRAKMPASLFNYVEYNSEFVKTSYDFPCVTDEEPHIWIAKDDLGLSEIEKNRALENEVDVSDENAIIDEKGIAYIGPPPSYEASLKL